MCSDLHKFKHTLFDLKVDAGHGPWPAQSGNANNWCLSLVGLSSVRNISPWTRAREFMIHALLNNYADGIILNTPASKVRADYETAESLSLMTATETKSTTGASYLKLYKLFC